MVTLPVNLRNIWFHLKKNKTKNPTKDANLKWAPSHSIHSCLSQEDTEGGCLRNSRELVVLATQINSVVTVRRLAALSVSFVLGMN